jgi:membrane-bound serine protease (ClpP class)
VVVAAGLCYGKFMRLIFAALLLLAVASTGARADGLVVVLEVKGPIGPASSDYIRRGIDKAAGLDAAVIVLRMDTPGGLDSSMREIIQAILGSPVPVATFVAPNGARAASAGTYILYASHIAAMAPATNLGAATPIQIGGGGGLPKFDRFKGDQAEDKDGEGKPGEAHPTMADKAVNDAVAYIRGLAEMRGRNADWAEAAVRKAVSLSAQAALKDGVVDLLAADTEDLLAKIDGRQVLVLNNKLPIAAAGAEVVELLPDWRSKLLGLVTNPNIAYILMLVGIYGLIFEVTHPGAVAPGVIGAIALVVGLFALNMLPINYAGLGLMLLGIAFMVAEAFLPAFGALGIGGIIAFVIGSVMLLDTDVPGFGISWPLIGVFAGTSALFFLIVLAMAVKARQRRVVSGQEDMLGRTGQVADWDQDRGHVRLQGEIWTARYAGALAPGAPVRVAALDGLVVEVEPLEETGEG